jgi:hypothetical protein
LVKIFFSLNRQGFPGRYEGDRIITTMFTVAFWNMDHAGDPLIVFNILDDALQFQAIYSFRTALCKNFGPMRALQN